MTPPTQVFASSSEPKATQVPVATNATQANDDDEADDEKVSCENEHVTGSRVKKRTICSNARQRRQLREDTQDVMDGVRVQGAGQLSSGN